MKYPRSARIFRGNLDVAPFASVFFLLVIFLLLASLIYTPGVRIQLPVADDLPGTDRPSVAVAVDSRGRLYYQNQLIGERELKLRLQEAAQASPEPLTLVVYADKALPYDNLIRLTMLAREAGIHESLLATLPRMFDESSRAPDQP